MSINCVWVLCSVTGKNSLLCLNDHTEEGTKGSIHWNSWKFWGCLTSWKLCIHILTSIFLSLHSIFPQSDSFPCCSTESVLTVRRLYLNYPNECVLTYINPYLLTAPQVFDILSSLNLKNASLFFFSSNCCRASKQGFLHCCTTKLHPSSPPCLKALLHLRLIFSPPALKLS